MAKRNVTEIVKEYLTAIGLRKVKREELDEAFLAPVAVPVCGAHMVKCHSGLQLLR